MAEFSSNPWVLYPADVGLEFHPGPMYIHQIVWSRYTDATHVCRLLDARGVEVFSARGETGFAQVVVNPGCYRVEGPLTLDQLQSGHLQIFVK